MTFRRSFGDTLAYPGWAREHDEWLSGLQAETLQSIQPVLASMSEPLFTLCVPAAAAEPGCGAATMLQALRQQPFAKWEAYIANPLAQLTEGDGRFNVLPPGLTEVEQCARALDDAGGRYFMVIPPGVALNRHALWLLAATVAGSGGPALVYTDSDRIDPAGSRLGPKLRTGWDPDLHLGGDAVGAVYAVRSRLARQVDAFQGQTNLGAALHGVVSDVAACSPASAICHVPAVLWHQTGPSDGTAPSDAEALRNAVGRHLSARGLAASVAPSPLLPGGSRLSWRLASPPRVSIIVPVRDRPDLLARCADGVLHRTDYAPFELLIVDNGSVEPQTHRLLDELRRDARVRVLEFSAEFNFSAINNYAVSQAAGDVVVFLNNDTDVIEPGWLTELVSHAMRPEIGAAGAKLLYADGRVQHCGVALGPDGVLGHQYRFAGRYEPGPLGELALCRTVLAVTAACMAMRRSVFHEAGGFDEDRFRVAFNDVDLCLRLGDLGYRIVCTPFAELFHLESTTRGQDDTAEKQRVAAVEFRHFRQLWDALLDNDQFYSPHLVFQWDDAVLLPPGLRPLLPLRGDPVHGGPSDAGYPPTGDTPAEDDGHWAVLRARAAARTRETRLYAHRLEDEVRQLRSELARHAAVLEQMQRDLESVAASHAKLEKVHHRVTQSTIWRASWPLRRIGSTLPDTSRSTIVRLAHLLWDKMSRKEIV